jgi:hypothetical protein
VNRPTLAIVGVIVSLFLLSCGLILEFPDTSGIEYYPRVENQILVTGENPRIRFDFAVDRDSVEALFTVKDEEGARPGIYHWDGQTVQFQAVPKLTPGRRYVLSFFGIFSDTRGVEYSVNRIIPFYYLVSNQSAPYVVSTSPGQGETIASDTSMHILFSKDIDPASLARGFSIDPHTNTTTRWENGTTELVLTPKERWKHCQCYTIDFSEEILDVDGIPLAEEKEVVFWVQEDVEGPFVVSIEPAFNLPAQLYPETGGSLEEYIDLECALRVAFSEAMEQTSTEAALFLDPPVSVILVWLDALTLVLVPEVGFAPDTDYLLDFTAEAVDLVGNPLDVFEPVRFRTISGLIEVSTELVHDGIILGPEDYGTASGIEIEPYPITSNYDYTFVFNFTGAVFDSNTEKMVVQKAISLICIFPDDGLGNPTATGFSWTADSRLSITYSDLQPSTNAQCIYYLLCIRGEPGGVGTDGGKRLEKDLEQLLIAAME